MPSLPASASARATMVVEPTMSCVVQYRDARLPRAGTEEAEDDLRVLLVSARVTQCNQPPAWAEVDRLRHADLFLVTEDGLLFGLQASSMGYVASVCLVRGASGRGSGHVAKLDRARGDL